MIRRTDEYFAVISMGVRMCWTCAELPATLDGKFCCRVCRGVWRHMAHDPDPTEIRQLAGAIRAQWSKARRRVAKRDEMRLPAWLQAFAVHRSHRGYVATPIEQEPLPHD
jgi:hypothetical protein